MLEFWSHTFFFSIKNTYIHSEIWTILQPTKIQEFSSHFYAFMILCLIYLYTTQTKSLLNVCTYCQSEHNIYNTVHSILIYYTFQPFLAIIR